MPGENILRSLLHPDQQYIGSTGDLKSVLQNTTQAKYRIHPNSNHEKENPTLLLKPTKKLSHLKLILKQAPVTLSPNVIFDFYQKNAFRSCKHLRDKVYYTAVN